MPVKRRESQMDVQVEEELALLLVQVEQVLPGTEHMSAVARHAMATRQTRRSAERAIIGLEETTKTRRTQKVSFLCLNESAAG